MHMSDDKGYRPMTALIASLQRAAEGMQSGSLGLDGLDRAVGDARELYERLVVLRHKAREHAHVKASKAVPPPEPPPAPIPPAPAPPTIRLDTRPADPRQISLIEAITDTVEEKPPQPAAKPTPPPAAKAPESLAERLEKARISDLGKAISVSHKFWFTAELFGGDKGAYESGIARLNAAADAQGAMAILEGELLAKLQKPPAPEALETFIELLQRRFA